MSHIIEFSGSFWSLTLLSGPGPRPSEKVGLRTLHQNSLYWLNIHFWQIRECLYNENSFLKLNLKAPRFRPKFKEFFYFCKKIWYSTNSRKVISNKTIIIKISAEKYLCKVFLALWQQFFEDCSLKVPK